jgi:hypothetical protein
MFQPNSRPTIEAFLTALYFSKPLTSREIYYILDSQVKNPINFLAKALKDGYLIKTHYDYKLSPKGLSKVNTFWLTLDYQKNKGTLNVKHSNLIIKCLFLLLKHIEPKQIYSITREKTTGEFNNKPDLTIATKNINFLIEADTGTERLGQLETKLRRYSWRMDEEKDFIIFLTTSRNTYNKLQGNKTAHLILLDQPDTSTQILELKHHFKTCTISPQDNNTDLNDYKIIHKNQKPFQNHDQEALMKELIEHFE